LWENQEEKGDPDYMLGIIFQITQNNGQNSAKPAGVIVGNQFEGVLQYRNACCSGSSEKDVQSAYSMLVFVEQNGAIRHKTLDTPVTKASCLRKFENLPKGIEVNSGQIAHMIIHHNKGAGYDCGHDHGKLPKLRA
jgi:hypothetical protein